MKKYLVEFIGTFFLVLAVGMAVIDPGAGSLAPLAIGLTLMIMVYAGGHVSGGHYNPAVTLAVWLRGRCATKDVLPYWISQIVGSVIAAFLVVFLKGYPNSAPQSLAAITIGNASVFLIKIPVQAFLGEFIGAFALTYVVLNVATAKSTAGNSFYGLAIGLTITAMAFAFGGISGGAFNPAVAVGITVLHLEAAANLWIYLVANLAAGALAATVFKFINPEDK